MRLSAPSRVAAALRWIGVLLTLASCSQAGETKTAPTPYSPPQVVARPTAVPTAVPLDSQAGCSDAAQFLEDLTLPDGTRVEPGEQLIKRWLIMNSGSCNWGAGYLLVRIDESEIVGPPELALYPTLAGETATWQISLTAPQQAGEHIASWQARSPGGEFFGDPVFILIEVGP